MPSTAQPGSFAPPAAILSRHEGWKVMVAYQYAAPNITYRLEAPGGAVRFLKLAAEGSYPTLASEAERVRWAGRYVSAPVVVEVGRFDRGEWLLTEALAGRDASHPSWRSDAPRLVRTLASTLRELHDVPAAECPFDSRLATALDHARRRVEAGAVVPERDFHTEFRHHSPASALEFLYATRPAREDLVVCHGDFCLPNIVLDDWRPSGVLDLGELGVADRWWDLAVATWSLTWNLGPGFEDLFLHSYGIESDPERSGYYRLLYDLVS